MSRRLSLALLSGVLAGCLGPKEVAPARGAASASSPPDPLASVRPASAPSAPPLSPFHVALVEDPHAQWPRVVPSRVRGRTILVGSGVVLDATAEGVKAAPDLAAPTLEVTANPEGLYGRWPDALWMDAFEGAGAWRVGLRWSGGRWAKVSRWEGHTTGLASFRDGFVADGLDAPPDRDGAVHGDAPRLSFLSATGGVKRVPGSRLLALPYADHDGVPAPGVQDFAAVDGALFIVAEAGGPDRLMVERLGPDGTPSELAVVAERAATAHLWTRSACDVVAFGGAAHADERPILSHYDGARWTPLEAPPGVDVIVGYDRTTAGVERAFAARGLALSLWERPPGEAWRSVLMPAIPEGEAIDGQFLTDDDAWLHVSKEGHAGRLLRLRPVTHRFDVGAPTPVVPVAQGEGALAAALPAGGPVPASDPSPFHDAVIGAVPAADAPLADALRLCPVRGRTLVCGASAAPLVATDDGVVADESAEAAIREGRGASPGYQVTATGGAWPDDAFVISRVPGTIAHRAYRHDHGRWREVTELAGIGAQFIEPWHDGTFVAPFRPDLTGPGAATFPAGLSRRGGGRSPFVTRLLGAGAISDPYGAVALGVARGGDALFVAAPHGAKLAVERLLPGVDRVDDIAELGKGSDLTASVWARAADDAVVFGEVNEAPLLARFDGRAWGAVALPPGLDKIVAYDRTSRGVERVFATSREAVSLYERARGADAFSAVVLPTLAHGDTIADVWLVNDDAWLLVAPGQPDGASEGAKVPRASRLMRITPVRRVWTPPRETLPVAW